MGQTWPWNWAFFLKGPGHTETRPETERLPRVKKTSCDLSLGNSHVGPERCLDPEERSHIVEVSASVTAFSGPSGLVRGESFHVGI